jgi:hypothetical protein
VDQRLTRRREEERKRGVSQSEEETTPSLAANVEGQVGRVYAGCERPDGSQNHSSRQPGQEKWTTRPIDPFMRVL